MENPCKKCLIRPICIDPCEELNKFSRSLSHIKDYDKWIKNYECRPAVLELVKNLQINLDELMENPCKKMFD